jgi:hypothetical protein
VGGVPVAEGEVVGLTWKAFLSEQKADCVSFRRSSAIVVIWWPSRPQPNELGFALVVLGLRSRV